MNWYEEINRCKDDFLYFASKYLHVVHPKRGLILFEVYSYHKRLLKLYEQNHYVIGAKFRQGGFTTFDVLYGLWQCMFFENKHVVVLEKQDRSNLWNSRIVRKAVENLPEELKPNFTVENDHYRQFVNGNSIGFYTPIQMCSKSFNHLMIQEAAYIRDMEEHWKSFVVTDDCKVTSISSVNGQQGWFHKTYRDALEGRNNFVLFDTHFREHPEYGSEEFEEEMRFNLGKKGFVQEVLCHFLECKSSI